MTVVTPKFGMGASVLRLEDQAFITGKGRYTDDISPAGMLHGYVLRSPVAKASFTIASIEAAKAAPGVHLVLTGADLTHLGDAEVRCHAAAARRHQGADPRHPDPMQRPGQLCRRRRRLRRCRQPRAGAGRGRD